MSFNLSFKKYNKNFLRNYPCQIIIFFLLAVTLIGTFLLALPISRKISISFLDLFFTAASLISVTGLTTVPINEFTTFGQLIILLLIQIGGLGIITLSLFFLYIFSEISLTAQFLTKELLSIKNFKDAQKFLIFIVSFSLISELLGACFIFSSIYKQATLPKALLLSFFTAVSAFCNAGFTLFNNNLISFNNNLLLFIISILMLIGGLGFITLYEFFLKLKSFWNQEKIKITWHTKLVLKAYFITTALSSILLWLLERSNTLIKMNKTQELLNIAFTAISIKSTGFLTINLNYMHNATIFLITLFIFIGTAPLSTGSGIKLTTLTIYYSMLKATILGNNNVNLNKRQIMPTQIYKALAIIGLAACWIIFTIFCLLITEQQSFFSIFIEAISAFSNSGISTGITPNLTKIGKLFIAITMLAGRICALTIVIGMYKENLEQNICYPEEKLILV